MGGGGGGCGNGCGLGSVAVVVWWQWVGFAVGWVFFLGEERYTYKKREEARERKR